jgi:2-alkenal reductase
MSYRRYFVPLMAGVAVLALACSPSADATNESAASNGAVEALSDSALSRVDVALPRTESVGRSVAETQSPASLPSLSELDPGLIVAAQEQVLNSIYVQLLPSVVQIEVSQFSDGGGRGFGPFNFGGDNGDQQLIPRGEGSGFIWDTDGHIVTNWHVIDGADEIIVLFEDGLELKAELLGSDKDSDLAVLKVSLPSDRYVPVMKGDSDLVRVGQLVAAIGDPFGQEFTLTSGIVSAVGRTIRGGTAFSIPEVIQTDAAINPGNSGGPLLDRTGRVIGINSQIISRSGSNAGVGFAIPINVAKRVIPALIKDGKYVYAYIGISGITLRADAAEEIGLGRETRGALLIQVTEGGPASMAGLIGSDEDVASRGSLPPLGGDVIIAINGIEVRTVDDVIAFVAGAPRPGDQVILTVLRDGEVLDFPLTLGTRPASAD